MDRLRQLPRVPDFEEPKGQWLDPELSIGLYLGIYNDKSIWLGDGPARKLFDGIKIKIKETLSSVASESESNRFLRGLSWTASRGRMSFDIFMVGETSGNALPHIMFACSSPLVRMAAVIAIRDSHLLHRCPPGVCLGHWHSPPNRDILEPSPFHSSPFDLGRSRNIQVSKDHSDSEVSSSSTVPINDANIRLDCKEINKVDASELTAIFLEKRRVVLFRNVFSKDQIRRPLFALHFQRCLGRFASNLKDETYETAIIHTTDTITASSEIISEIIQQFLQSGAPLEAFQDSYAEGAVQGKRTSGVKRFFRSTSNERKIRRKLPFVSSTGSDLNFASNAIHNTGLMPGPVLHENVMAMIIRDRNFIKGSKAFKDLQEDFMYLAAHHWHFRHMKQPGFEQADRESKSCQWFFELFDLYLFKIILLRSWIEALIDLNMGFKWMLSISAAFGLDLELVFSRLGLSEKSIPRNHRRFRWTTRSGKKIYDDYVEHEYDAIQSLQHYLETTTVPVVPGNTNIQNRTTSSTFSAPDSSSSSQSRPGERSSSLHQGNLQAVNSSNAQVTANSSDIEVGRSSVCPLFLLSCVDRRGHPIKLHQEVVTHVTDDRELFHTLRKIYYSQRKLTSFWSLRTLHGIHFMKFGYGGHGLVDVRSHNELCESHRPCLCIPPESLVFPQGSEYACRPVPSKLSPPYGPRLLMELFKDPDSRKPRADSILQQFPKRMNLELDLDEAEMNEAWGIYYREDWDWTRIWAVLGIAFFPPSLLFGILWGVLKRDIQGAFGIASWWMTGATIVVGIIGTCT